MVDTNIVTALLQKNMKKIILLSLLFITSLLLIGCSNKSPNDNKNNENTTIPNNNIKNESEVKDSMETTTNIKISINDKKYNAMLEDNETAQAFAKLLPQEFEMSELNGNEKYIYMDNSLPTKPYKPKHIKAGDIMLYGNNCLVIFYESFETNYSYTKIGHIDNLPNLGNGNITISFSK